MENKLAKNIVIFSDGTGQRGGVYFDEARTNIYKLYRATRVAPDSCIQPNEQVAFYDPGLGTQPAGGTAISRTWRAIYNFLSQATGLGITRNIIDCYAAIIQLWSPGDRIYLFGFSRGAYTVRCLATVICYCGIPSQDKNNLPLKRDTASATRIATEAVKSVYQHVSSLRDAQYFEQRNELAQKFRADYGCGGGGQSEFPFFIGVFDTVAALTNFGSLSLLTGIIAILLIVSSFGLSLISHADHDFWYWLGWLAFDSAFCLICVFIFTHLKFSFHLKKHRWWETVHLTTLRQEFYDNHLDTRVSYARHAISIDERRSDFARVKWGNRTTEWTEPGKIDRFKQIWFAGNHADIGGGYSENESRLSDIALKWMVEATQGLTDEKLVIDKPILQPKPSCDGKQHDETRSLAFRLAGKSDRELVTDATLHPTVEKRFKLDEVLQYDVMAKYRPESLRAHSGFEPYYADVPLPRVTCWQTIKSGWRKRRHRFTRESNIGRFNTWLFAKFMELRMDRVASCIGLLFGLLGALGCTGILAVQSFYWLSTGLWWPLPLKIAANCLKSIGSDWVGLQTIFDWILRLPLSLAILVVGYSLFWAFGVISAKLYKQQVDARDLVATPSQTHA